MPDALADVGVGARPTNQNSSLVTSELQPKVCSVCAGPISSPSQEASTRVAPVCRNCTRTTEHQDTHMHDATRTRTLNGSISNTMEHPTRSGANDETASKGNIIKDNNTTKPTLKVIKVDFPGRSSNTDSVTPTTAISPSQSLVSARTISLRSPVAEHTLSAALKAHIQRQSLLDPFLPLTTGRVSSRGYDCLYPGALFEGMQTNKTKEHRVSVRIVDVNIEHSTLSGFLTIHDLTDQLPELTTFFDGQIIGHQYGFVTNDWGATEKTDATHWLHFPPYHQIQASELSKPKLTFKNPAATLDRGLLFMRWKERFLVPDHRVKSINGASYAGFYYICMEFGSLMGGLHADALHPHATDEMEEDEEEDAVMTEDGTTHHEPRRMRGTRRNSSHTHSSMRAPSASGRDDDKSPPRAYAHGQSPYAASSSYAPSTSPVTGANRITRAVNVTGGRRRRTSIYTAGSVPLHVHDHGHHGHPPYSSAYVPSGYGVGPPSLGATSSELLSSSYPPRASREFDLDVDVGEDREMRLEDALELDPVDELRRQQRREMANMRRVDRSRSRSMRRREDEYEEGKEYGYGYGRRGAGWMGPARLTGYYNHSEKDHCDLYQKLELHHVPERTRGSFEFR